jgi:hypothetical protein
VKRGKEINPPRTSFTKGPGHTVKYEIPLFPPFSKGDLSEETYLRISSKPCIGGENA